MKREEEKLRRLFKEWGKNQQPSISFESIWQKTKRKQAIQAVSYRIALVTAVLLAILIIQPQQLFMKEQINTATSGQKEIMMKGSVIGLSTKIVIRGQSNLPEGAVIQAALSEDDEGKIVALKETVKVDKRGNFTFVIQRPVIERNYVLSVAFLPELQPQFIQQIYGEHGQQIEQSEATFTYAKDGITYRGLKLYDQILGITGTIAGQNTFLSSQLRDYPKN
jgi:hypothetical protein